MNGSPDTVLRQRFPRATVRRYPRLHCGATFILTLGLALLVTSGCQINSQANDQQDTQTQTQTQATADPAPKRAPLRVFIRATDLEVSLEFYRDLLGFGVLLIADYDSDHMRAFAKLPKDVIPKVAILSADGKNLAFSIYTAENLAVDREANRRFAPTLILDRTDLHAIHRSAQRAGYDIVFAPEDTLDDNQQLHSRELGLVDPDGNRVLLIEKFETHN